MPLPPGESFRLTFRSRRHRRRPGTGRNSFAAYHDLIVRAHIQFQTPIVLVWDNLNNLNTHRTAGVREYAAEHDWLPVMQLPSCAPDLNRRGLRHMRLRPNPIDGCLTETGPRPKRHPTTPRQAR
ncbi:MULTISPECIES: DDE endonuclease [unclassified Streptomyces]|uniref:DDE endonuclease n=1 Tax=Streptomyces TaxID=1883 RepID=UPI0031BA851D